MINVKKILVLSPHTDDAELGCGGLINKLINEKKNVFYLAFSYCQESLSKKYKENTLIKECQNSTNVLGLKKRNVKILNYPVRNFHKYRQEILEQLTIYKNKIKPDLILTPTKDDIHQDHKIIYEETIRAFKKKTIFGYELPWNCIKGNLTIHVSLNKKNVEKKISALMTYKSQKKKKYFNKNYLLNHLINNGFFIDEKYSEKFEPIKIKI